MNIHLKHLGGALAALLFSSTVFAQSAPYPFTLISRITEANPRVVAIAIDFGRELPINWRLENAFKVSAELKPVKSYAGDPIANSAAAKSPRTVTAAYTSAKPEIGSASQGRYVIVELDRDDFNASSWYIGFNPGIRQMIPYGENMGYEVSLQHDLNVLAPNVSPTVPGPNVELIKTGAAFKQAGARIQTADQFARGLYEMPDNPAIKFLPYNLYKPAGAAAGAKVPLVVFLHGSGQSHDYKAFANDHMADVVSPLYASQGGTTWIENTREKAFVLVPQAPARDTRDAAGEWGWRSADTVKLLLALVDKVIAENPSIDTNRLYLTGLSMGAMGSWKLISDADPRVSRKFAAASVFAGVPKDIFAPVPNETPAAKQARIQSDLQAQDLRHVSIPVWIAHADTDPVVNSLGSRVPFSKLTGKAPLSASGDLQPAPGVLRVSNDLVRIYHAQNASSGNDVIYAEYQFGQGERFRELGMMTRHGHFSWEAAYKDQGMIDWMFRQVRRP